MKKLSPYLTLLIIFVLASGRGYACDLCAVYRSVEAKAATPGPNLGLFEQYTHFGTMQLDGREVANPAGQKLDSSITQFIAGYQVNDRFGVQLNVPYIHRSFRRPTPTGAIDNGTETGLGEMTLVAHYRPLVHLTENTIVAWDVTGGVKFPTGSPARIKEELSETEPEPGVPESGIHGHDLALGSGSYDGIVGSSIFASWQRLFVTGAVQYAIRSRGAYGYRYADDLGWHVKPGGYLWLTHEASLGLQLALSGEHKGKDDLNGVTAEDTGMTAVFLGPEFSYTWQEHLSAELGAEFPLLQNNTALQLVPDYRVKAALTWRF